MSLKDLILRNQDNEEIFILTETDTFSYCDIIKQAVIYANLLKNNYNKRVNIGLILPNSVEYIEWLFAIILSDNLAVPIFNQSSSNEIKNIIKSCDISLCITSIDCNIFYDIAEECRVSYINCFDNTLIKTHKGSGKKSLAPNNIRIMISTSGSTNNPKRVMLSDENIISNAEAISESLHYTNKEIFGIFLPLCFASANISQLFTTLILGSTLALYNGIKMAGRMAKFIHEKKITTITLVPSLFKIIVESTDFILQHMPTLKTICFGGGPSCETTIECALKKFKGINLTHMYGQTEAATRISHMCSKYMTWKKGSVGKPLKGIKVKLIPTDNHEQEICISGPNVTCGYYRQKKLSNDTLKNGWLHTGDLGKIDNDGYLYITGRKRNLIIYCGLNVYPEEIENIINQISIVDDVIVYGKKDKIFGERICADIILKKDTDSWENIIITYCEKLLPNYKIPSELKKVSTIERTNNGKIKRNHKIEC